ncbi:MAG: oligosaccharide flippase family protein [Chitinophagaceae bacterium]|nr:oligosaccharide flippase family protein [Chitinophagaceae bacterium]
MKLAAKYWVLADQVVVSGGAFITNLLVARALGITSYGLFSAILLAQLLVLSLLQAAFSGIMPVVWARLPLPARSAYASGLFWMHAGILCAVLVLGGLLYAMWPQWWQAGASVWWPALLAAVLYFLQDYLRRWMLATEAAPRALIMDVISNGAQLLLLLAGWWQGWLRLHHCLWIIALTFLPSVLLGLWWLRPGRPQWAHMRMATRQHVPSAKWMLSSALLQWTAGNYYILAAGWWLGPAALGALRLAQYIFGLLNVLLQALENYALPGAARLHQAPQQLFAFLLKMLRQLAMLFVPLLLLLVLLRQTTMQLAGGTAFVPYSYVMVGMALLYVFVLIGYPVRLALRVQLLNKHYFIGYVITTVFSMLTARLLVGQWGLAGVLAGMISAQCILLLYWLYILSSKNRISWKSFTWYLGK